jgi:predicted O-methyltransferase YrrM
MPPAVLAQLLADTEALGFQMASDSLTGSLLRTLAASKPDGVLLELGTGTGIATAWLLDGMNANATLDSVDNDPDATAVARRHLAGDRRLTLHLQDAGEWLQRSAGRRFDLIFADTWAGKYHSLDEALSLLTPGGFYVVDDMLPQPEWSEEHRLKAAGLLQHLEGRQDLNVCRLDWATGLLVATRRHSEP